jgi:beta-lactamase superfamily II metal-dependent hydrolase
MSDIFRINVFPAQRGDAIWIEYGPEAQPFRILVDGGITKTGREHIVDLVRRLGNSARIDLLVVTHIDLDHILGVIALLEEFKSTVEIKRVWFNGWDQLPRDQLQPHGVKEGIALSTLLEDHHTAAWNVDANGGSIGVTADGAPRKIPLPGEMVATILSPDTEKLLALKEDWEEIVEAFGAADEDEAPIDEGEVGAIDGLEPMGAGDIDVAELAESKFTEDKTVPNGSSIAFLLEFKGRSALLLADAHPSLVLKGLQALSPGAPVHTDCVKLSHHGSKNNTSRALVQHLRSPKWIFSSNGASTKHPNLEAVARVLHDSPGSKLLVFNYQTKYNEMWDDDELMEKHDYKVGYGDGVTPVTVDLLP